MKTKFLLLAFSLIFLINCGDDDDNSASYIGNWIATNIVVEDCDDPNNDQDERPIQCGDIDCVQITFNSDNTYSFQEGLSTRSGDWSLSGSTISLCVEDDGESLCEDVLAVITESGNFLRLSLTNEANGCVTTYIMERQVEPEDPGTGQ